MTPFALAIMIGLGVLVFPCLVWLLFIVAGGRHRKYDL